jgi:hypothetical protein
MVVGTAVHAFTNVEKAVPFDVAAVGWVSLEAKNESAIVSKSSERLFDCRMVDRYYYPSVYHDEP